MEPMYPITSTQTSMYLVIEFYPNWAKAFVSLDGFNICSML